MQWVRLCGRERECAALVHRCIVCCSSAAGGAGEGVRGRGYSHICHNNSHRYQFLFVFTLELFFVGDEEGEEREEEERETHFGHMAPFFPIFCCTHTQVHKQEHTHTHLLQHWHSLQCSGGAAQYHQKKKVVFPERWAQASVGGTVNTPRQPH